MSGEASPKRGQDLSHNRRMVIADLVPRRLALGGRLPNRIEDLRGPVKGVILLPRNLSWPGMRECDVSDDRGRRSLYGMLLAQGHRNDIARFVNGNLLRQDWPLLRKSLEPRLARRCERRFGLGAAAAAAATSATASPG
jgi:hypothetical protein